MRVVTFAEVHADGDLLLECLCPSWQHAAHPNSSVNEDAGFVRFSPDPTVYTTEQTPHVPIDHWHSEQRTRADLSGAEYDLMEGPSPFGGLDHVPDNFPDMHIDPDSTWHIDLARSIQNMDQAETFLDGSGGLHAPARGRAAANAARTAHEQRGRTRTTNS